MRDDPLFCVSCSGLASLALGDYLDRNTNVFQCPWNSKLSKVVRKKMREYRRHDFDKRFNYAYRVNVPVFVSERRLDGGCDRKQYDVISDFHSRKMAEIASPADCLGWGIARIGIGLSHDWSFPLGRMR